MNCVNVASAMVVGTNLTLRRPAAALQPYLGCFWALQTTSDTRLRSLPDACATISVTCSPDHEPECFLVGLRSAATETTPPAGKLIFGVRLRPGVVFLLGRVRACQLVDKRVRLAEFLGEEGGRLETRLAAVKNGADGIGILEDFLLDRLRTGRVDSRVQKALQLIDECRGQVRVSQLADKCRVSVRHLDRLLRQWVGFPPKRLARIARFQTALREMESPSPGGFAPIATKLGYFDQAHLANEVALFAGSSPGRIAPCRVTDFSKTRCE